MSTAIIWANIGISYFAALGLIIKDRRIEKLPYQSILIAYLAWVFVSATKGALIADNYWYYKNLILTTASVLMPLLVWILASPALLAKILKYWVRFALPTFCIFYFLITSEAYGFYLAPLVLFVVLLPLLRVPQQLLVLALVGIIALSNLDARSHILRFSVPLTFGCLFLFRRFFGTTFIRASAVFFFLTPIVLLALGITGTFNVFKMQDYIHPERLGLSAKNYKMVTADTRTFIYREVWESAIRHDYVLHGRSLSRGYDSVYFGDHQLKELGTGNRERSGSEVGLANIFTCMGLIGVILYSAIFLLACHLAINHSASFALKLIGLYVSFRWAYCWVEEHTVFSIFYFPLWMLVAICWSPKFRSMSDTELRDWIRPLIPNLLKIPNPRMIN